MRVTKSADERKLELINAGELLFLKQGYKKTTVEDIINEVGIAKGTFYYYFKSKKDLMDQVVMNHIKESASLIDEISKLSNKNATEKIALIIKYTQESDNKEELLNEVHSFENAEMHQKSLVESIKYLAPIFGRIIQEGVNEGSFHQEYPQECAELILTYITFVFDQELFNLSNEDLFKKITALLSFSEKLLGTEEGHFNFILKYFI